MNRYQQGLIYQIRQRGTTNIFYIGSTCNLRKRRQGHKDNCNNVNRKQYDCDVYKYMRSIGGYECCIIEKICDFPCNTKQELGREEGLKIVEYINKGYNLKNYRVEGQTKKEYRTRNREKYLKQVKEYNDAHKEEHKLYRKQNKEKIKKFQKDYREQNKAKLDEWKKIKTICNCGGSYTNSCKSRHMKSKKHLNYMESLN